MSKPAARVGDMHSCPMSDGPKPHVGGPILPPGEMTVMIAGQPAARVGDLATCASAPDAIVQGSFSVLIGGRPAARLGDMTAHGGVILVGCPNVLIGDASSAGGPLGPFSTQDEAARAALNAANPASIAENREYCGMIYQDPATGQYYATNPQPIGQAGGSLPVDQIPAGAQETGFYHTHGNYSLQDGTPTDAAHDAYDSEHFSQTDINTANSRAAGNPDYQSYLGTPSGGYQVHNPSTGQISPF
jgi:uncharacterized Zn-binding protein involved in type VI secretion